MTTYKIVYINKQDWTFFKVKLYSEEVEDIDLRCQVSIFDIFYKIFVYFTSFLKLFSHYWIENYNFENYTFILMQKFLRQKRQTERQGVERDHRGKICATSYFFCRGVKSDFIVSVCPFLKSFRNMCSKGTQRFETKLQMRSIHKGIYRNYFHYNDSRDLDQNVYF